MKNQRKNVQIVSSAETPDLWEVLCVKSGTQYVFRDKLERPYPSVGAHLDKLSKFPPPKMHNSESVISFSSKFSVLVASFKFLSFNDNLQSVNLLNQAVRKFPRISKRYDQGKL